MPKSKIHNSRCLVCNHMERGRIEMLSVHGASVRSLSRKFGVSYHSIWRHLQGHLDADRRASLVIGRHRQDELAELAAGESVSVLDHLKSIRLGLFAVFDAATAAADAVNAAVASKALHENLLATARVTGELKQADATSSSPPSRPGDPLALDIASMSTQERQAKMREILEIVRVREAAKVQADETTAEAADVEAAPAPAA